MFNSGPDLFPFNLVPLSLKADPKNINTKAVSEKLLNLL